MDDLADLDLKLKENLSNTFFKTYPCKKVF
jgi:hypothetical protein